MAAYWFEAKREKEPPSMWAPPGAPYLLNINHPNIRGEFERAKRAFGVPTIYPMGDFQRMVWEVDMIKRYSAQWEEMPQHVRFRLKVPPYKGLWETTPSTAVQRSPSLDERGIKKDR